MERVQSPEQCIIYKEGGYYNTVTEALPRTDGAGS
jgi:hypothetical protein